MFGKDWKPGDVDKRKFLRDAEPIINSAIKSYGGGDHSLKTRARVMALDALKTYDASKNVAFKTHLHNSLHGLSRYARQRRDPIHIPEKWAQDFDRLKRAEAELESERGRPPTLVELSDHLGIPERRLKMLRARMPDVMSESAVTTEKGDLVKGSETDPMTMWADYVYHEMNDVDKKIFEMGTEYGGGKVLPKGEIARKLGISSSAVSQRINRIADKLQQGVNL